MTTTFTLPPIYPLTDTASAKASHFDQAVEMIDGGAELIQLREKSMSDAEFLAEARRVVAYVRRRPNVRILINDRVDIARISEADGVHLGQDDLSPYAAREILGERAIIGVSTHSISQAVAALKMPVDYIAAGPVFPTRTKTDHESVIGLDGIKEIRAVIGQFPLVAIGGITANALPEVFAAGADAAAIISEITAAPSIRSAVEQLIHLAKR